MKRLAIVIPCYNEEEALPYCVAELTRVLSDLFEQEMIAADSAIYFVDDGSRDRTWALIEQYAAESKHIHGIKLSGNRGQQHALLAGLLSVDADMLITMDVDLQDDVAAIPAMVRHHLAGAEIVYAVRSARDMDTAFKRISAQLYYKFLHWLRIRIIYNHADYRLLGREAREALAQYGEVNLFLRGMIPQLGFTTAYVEYTRNKRVAGVSKYPLLKMLGLAWDGITSFSSMPLRVIFLMGLATAATSFILVLYALWQALFTTHAVAGWASTVVPLLFLGGVQLLSLGVIGEYIGKIYLETKARPRFHIEKQV